MHLDDNLPSPREDLLLGGKNNLIALASPKFCELVFLKGRVDERVSCGLKHGVCELTLFC